MAFNLADRVKETSTSTGSGAFTLAGAVSGFQAFASGIAVGDTTWYAIVGGAEWEVGLGTLTAAATLARTTVFASSNANAAVSFSAGTKEVFITAPGDMLEVLNGLQTVLEGKAPKVSPVFSGLTEIAGAKLTVVPKGNSGTTAQSFPAATNAAYTLTNTGAHTWSFSWPPGYAFLNILVTNAGAFAITMPTVNWLVGDGTTSTTFSSQGVTLQASGVNQFIFESWDGGTTVYGRAA